MDNSKNTNNVNDILNYLQLSGKKAASNSETQSVRLKIVDTNCDRKRKIHKFRVDESIY